MIEKKIYTVDDLADRWEMHRQTIIRLANNGDIPMFKVGKQHRIRKDVLERFELDRALQTQKHNNGGQ